MNAELAAMNKISKAVEAATDRLDAGARERVLQWFVDWTYAQIEVVREQRHTDTAKDTA
jgi:hypothetical protein